MTCPKSKVIRIVLGLAVLASLLLLDVRIHDELQVLKTPIGFKIMKTVSFLGTGGVLLLFSCLLLLVGLHLRQAREQEAARYCIYALAFSGILVQVLKHLIGRPRPRLAQLALYPIGPSLASGYDSFPSGHVTSAFATALVLAHYYPRGKICFYGFAVLVAFSRIYINSHYASDVFAGACFGIVSTLPLFHWTSMIEAGELRVAQSFRDRRRGRIS